MHKEMSKKKQQRWEKEENFGDSTLGKRINISSLSYVLMRCMKRRPRRSNSDRRKRRTLKTQPSARAKVSDH
jgi:hypothetical protein